MICTSFSIKQQWYNNRFEKKNQGFFEKNCEISEKAAYSSRSAELLRAALHILNTEDTSEQPTAIAPAHAAVSSPRRANRLRLPFKSASIV